MSALIFVALAGAWAVYLVPKALRQQEDADAVRGVESFSERLRVIDPRKVADGGADRPDQADQAHKVVEPVETSEPAENETHTDDEYVVEPVRLTPVQLRLRRAAARKAAQRRRRVLVTLVLTLLATIALRVAGTLATAWVLAPLVLIAAWLVACRLMVKKETAARTRVVKKRRTTLADQAIADETAAPAAVEAGEAGEEPADGTEEIPAVGPASASTWEPVPMTLPTYVDKAAASRTVRTIDLDATGVWSSGRNAGDSEIAREAETSRRTEQQSAQAAAERRATGS